MERGNGSLEALKELTYISSLDSYERADALVRWSKKYLISGNVEEDFELDRDGLKRLRELFYNNIKFLQQHKEKTRKDMVENRKLRKFFNH